MKVTRRFRHLVLNVLTQPETFAIHDDMLDVVKAAVASGQIGTYHESQPYSEPGPRVLPTRATVCVLETDEGDRWTGYALCSMRDNFSRKRGRDIAYGRALKALRKGLGLPKKVFRPPEVVTSFVAKGQKEEAL